MGKTMIENSKDFLSKLDKEYYGIIMLSEGFMMPQVGEIKLVNDIKNDTVKYKENNNAN
jgi:hypothetical protein